MKFDAYEYIGVIVPGTIVLYTVAVLYPSLLLGLTTSLSLADLGVALVLAFIGGHLVQAGDVSLTRTRLQQHSAHRG